MKKFKYGKEIMTIIIVLTAIALVSGLLLGVLNKYTAVDEDEVLKQRISKLYSSPVTPIDISGYQNIADTEIVNAFKAEDGAYIIESKSNKAYSSKGLNLIVIIKDGKVIKINGEGNSETPGLGTKALTDSYFQNFIGKTYAFFAGDEGSESQKGEVKIGWGFEKEEDEDGHSGATPSRQDIAAVSGATKSSNGVRNAVKAALAFYEYAEGGNE